MKHAKSMGTVSEILSKINLFSLGMFQILVLCGNAELVSVVKGSNKTRTVRQLKSQHSVCTCLGGPASAVGTLLHFSPGGSASTTHQLDDLGKAVSLPQASVSPSALTHLNLQQTSERGVMVVWISQKLRHKIRHVAEGRASSEQSDSAAPPLNCVALFASRMFEGVLALPQLEPATPKSHLFPNLHLCSVEEEGCAEGGLWGEMEDSFKVNRQKNPGRAESLVGRENTGTAQQ